MITLNILFWMFIALFAGIGAMRGWAKEILVTFSVILALFLINLLQTYIPILKIGGPLSATARLWFQLITLIGLSFFGYQTSNLRLLSDRKLTRERFQDAILGLIIGALNGYLIVGSIWFFIDYANYPYDIIIPPNPDTAAGQAALSLLSKMPPVFLVPPWIYFAVAIAFLFVVVVFI